MDLAGGVAVVYTAEGHNVTQADIDETVNILNLRVNGLGVSGAQVQSTGKNQISVSIPGVTNAQQVLAQIGQTARMYFRPVQCFAYPQGVPKTAKNKVRPPGDREHPGLHVVEPALTQANLGVTPENSPQGYPLQQRPARHPVRLLPLHQRRRSRAPDRHRPAARPRRRGRRHAGGERYLLGPSPDDGPLHHERQATQNQTGPVGRQVHPGRCRRVGPVGPGGGNRTSTSCSALSSTASCTRPDRSAHPDAFSSFNGQGEISGNLTQSDAQNLAQAMNFGALPVTLKAATSETVSATLGHSALVTGLSAGIAGLILVLLYVLLYYRALGLVVISGLVLTAMMLWAIISALGHTSVAPSFDLAGITGLIVSIGITVDSYIVSSNG